MLSGFFLGPAGASQASCRYDTAAFSAGEGGTNCRAMEKGSSPDSTFALV